MAAFNVVRFRVKPGAEEKFIEEHRNATASFQGFRRGSLIDAGDRWYCFVGEWDDAGSIAASEVEMVKILDRFRDTLEDLGDGKGVTDPLAGPVVVEMKS